MKLRRLAGGLLALVIVFIGIIVLRYYSEKSATLTVKTLDPWILQSNDPDNPYGTYLGNGYIAARINADGVGRNGPCYFSGLYNTHDALVDLPLWSDFALFDADGNRFELDKKAPYRQTLNMREGYVETELTLKSNKQRLVGKVTLFINRKLQEPEWSIAGISYSLVPTRNGAVVFEDKLDTSRGKWKSTATKFKNGRVTLQATADAPANGPVQGITLQCVVEDGKETLPLHITTSIDVKSGEVFTLNKLVAIAPHRKVSVGLGAPPMPLAASFGTFENEFSRSKASWQEFWKSDIIIEGDPEAQQIVHAMMFYLASSASPEASIAPMGLSDGAWQGHIFWDADIWMHPALALQHPDLASGIAKYRIALLEAAKQNAEKGGYKGAEFPWQSGGSGYEIIGPPFSDEDHITADVAIAAAYHRGMEGVDHLLRSTAEYWASRVTYNKVKDRYEILNVLPPDEDVKGEKVIDNSVYTNAAAKRNIELAIESAKANGSSYPALWEEIAVKMYLPFDDSNNRFLEYEGYDGHRTKQADTELIIYPLTYPMTDEVKAATYDFYKTKTDQRGPAMTSSIHSIIAAELGRSEEAYQQFVDSYKEFLRGPLLMLNEKRSTTYDNMCFVTGCGGTLQSVIYGFAGLRTDRNPGGFAETAEGLYIKPCLPPTWKKLRLTNIQWREKTYDLTVLPGNKWQLVETH